MSIAEVIGWKHNHQPGMCCTENSDGILVITEFPDGIPSQADQDKWTAEYELIFTQTHNDAVIEISRLESTVTPRRMRDAVASVEGKTWLADIESKIAIERVKLNG